jgi:RNA polymerase sigma-70 factor (ECF subfamily)
VAPAAAGEKIIRPRCCAGRAHASPSRQRHAGKRACPAVARGKITRVPPADPETARWFDDHVRPHHAVLRAWLAAQFPVATDLDDLVQEASVRVLRAREAGPAIASPKALLFATARNLALMQLRHRRVARTDSLAEIDGDGILDETDVAAAAARSQELELLTQAIQSLPARCRQIITLRKIYGLPQREVAAQLGISEHTVEAQGTIGLRKLGEFFARLERGNVARASRLRNP